MRWKSLLLTLLVMLGLGTVLLQIFVFGTYVEPDESEYAEYQIHIDYRRMFSALLSEAAREEPGTASQTEASVLPSAMGEAAAPVKTEEEAEAKAEGDSLTALPPIPGAAPAPTVPTVPTLSVSTGG